MARKPSLVLSESAFSDLEALLNYHCDLGAPEAGTRIIDRLLNKIEKIVDHPERGRVVPEFGLERLREVIDPPFRIVYVRKKEQVRVVRVWRSERLLRLSEK